MRPATSNCIGKRHVASPPPTRHTTPESPRRHGRARDGSTHVRRHVEVTPPLVTAESSRATAARREVQSVMNDVIHNIDQWRDQVPDLPRPNRGVTCRLSILTDELVEDGFGDIAVVVAAAAGCGGDSCWLARNQARCSVGVTPLEPLRSARAPRLAGRREALGA